MGKYYRKFPQTGNFAMQNPNERIKALRDLIEELRAIQSYADNEHFETLRHTLEIAIVEAQNEIKRTLCKLN